MDVQSSQKTLHRGYPIFLPYPKAILRGLSHSYTSTFLAKEAKSECKRILGSVAPVAMFCWSFYHYFSERESERHPDPIESGDRPRRGMLRPDHRTLEEHVGLNAHRLQLPG